MNDFDQHLYKKYNVPGPRYTSYPTVPYWENCPDQNTWLNHLDNALQRAKHDQLGAGLYIHIPFCESLCTYCGCNTVITKNHAVGHPYIQSIHKEWQLYCQHLSQSNSIDLAEIHLGGGTPTFLTPEELQQLLEPILSSVTLTKGWEGSIEIDPRVTTEKHLMVLRNLGFSRLSIGIQDFDPKVQNIVNRQQSIRVTEQLFYKARDLGFQSINFDLIYGLPLQTKSSITTTFNKIITMKPDRIAFYAYAHVPWIKPSQRKFSEQDLPKDNDKRVLYELGRELLKNAGYEEIGMDHFALRSDTLWTALQAGTLHRNFMGYTVQNVLPIVALGISSIGDGATAFCQNEKSLHKYQAALDQNQLPIMKGHILTSEDLFLRKQILNLMTTFKTSWPEDHSIMYVNLIPEKLGEMIKDGLVIIDQTSTTITITAKGRPFLRNICMAFDARLNTKQPTINLFSKTI